MSLQSDLKTLLSSVTEGKFYAQAAPEDIKAPFIVYRILNKEPLQTMEGDVEQTRYSVVFECYAAKYADATDLAEQVATIIEESSLISFRDSSPGEEYILDVDEFMEPVYVGIWHS